MVLLNQSMLERYEIAAHRPERLGAVLIGTDPMLLGCAARWLEDQNIGAACVGAGAELLGAQDGMFTEIIRGNGRRTERVVQSILRVCAGEAELRSLAETAEADSYILSAEAGDGDFACLLTLLRLRREAGLSAPAVYLLSSRPEKLHTEALREMLGGDVRVIRVLADHLCGRMSDAEGSLTRREMNYRDEFLMWAEERCALVAEAENPLFPYGGFGEACERKRRIFDAAVFLIAPAGYLCGMDTFSAAMGDAQLREFVAHAFYDEVLPRLPGSREAVAEDIIGAFDRLSEPMNACPILSRGHMLSDFADTILPAIRACAREEFDVPPRLTFALAAAVMLYSGARREEASGVYTVRRGETSDALRDDASLLEAFSHLAHDMPAESLAYAVLADRSLWGEDLREVDGLEGRLTDMLSAIGRIGVRETMRLVAGA